MKNFRHVHGMLHPHAIVRSGRQLAALRLVLNIPDCKARLLPDGRHQVRDERTRVGPCSLISPFAELVLHGRHHAHATRMRGTHKVAEVLSQSLLVSLPRRVRDKDSDLIQLEPRGIIQISFRDRRVVLKPKFGVADGLGGLVIESSYPAEVFWHTTLRGHR